MRNLKKLSRAQRELVINSLISPDTAIGLTGGTMEIHGPIILKEFEEAINQLIDYHDAPRIQFEIIEDQIFQHIDANDQLINLQFEDYSLKTSPETLVEKRIQELFSKPFNLDFSSSLFRNYLFKLGSEHYIYFTYAHHALIDGWGYSLWTSNLIRLLDKKPAFATYSFLNYVEENTDWIETPSAQRSLEYWLKKLPTKPAALFSPIGEKTLETQNIRIRISAARYAKWQALADENQISIAALMSAALLLEAAGYNRVDVPVIGTPILNRPSAASKLIVGLFTHIIPLQANIIPGESLINFAKRITQIQRLDYRHSRISIGDISQSWDQESSDEEAIQATFSFEKHDYNQSLAGCELVIDALSPKTQSRPLQIYGREYQLGKDFLLDAYFNISYFSEESIQTLLKRWCARLDQRNSTENQLLPKSLPFNLDWSTLTSSNLWQSFNHIAHQYPEAIALEDEYGKIISYRDLLIQAQSLASTLRMNGANSGVSIGISCERKAELVIGILGILGCGGTYVPLDPRYPEDRIKYLLDDSNTSLVLADTTGANVCKKASPDIKILDIDKIIASASVQEFIEPTIDPLQAAYIIYTSGSTGNPKGCVVTHRNVTQLMASAGGLHAYSSRDVWTLFHSFAFDFSVWEIWGALLFGGKLIVVSYATSRDPGSFLDLLSEKMVTVLNQTPTAFRSILQVISEAHSENKIIKLNLRKIIFGGEALDPSILKPWFDIYGQNTTFINMYGITETTVHVTHKEINLIDLNKTSLIGDALPNWRLYILNASIEPVGQNQIGELFVGGLGVIRGYHNRPALTAERFLPDPFANDGSRMYRSGDLAKINQSRELEYLGRSDQQVKIRGFRIEIGEIEIALKSHPEILDAIVLAASTEDYEEKRLFAWFIQKNLAIKLQTEEIRKFLLLSLPEYMIPSRFTKIDCIPLTVNGKLDKAALPWPAINASNLNRESPLLGVESILAKTWQVALKINQVYRDDNFFTIGGDSISALKVISLLRQEKLFLRLSDLYKYNSLELLAAHCKTSPIQINEYAPRENEKKWETPIDVLDAYPMAALQAGMLFHSTYELDLPIFLDVFHFKILHQWHEVQFRDALEQITKDYAALRTGFDWENYSEPIQLVYSDLTIPLQVDDLSNLDEQAQREKIQALIELEKNRPFDTRTPPLIRFAIRILSANSFTVVVSFHHAIIDGWSFATLFTRLLRYFTDPKLIGKLPKTIELQKKHVYSERASITDSALNDYWQKYLLGMPSQIMPESQNKLRKPIRKTFLIEQNTLLNLKKLAHSLSIPLKTLFLGVHFLSLLEFTKQDEICTGYVVNCRPELNGAEESVGLFLNTIPLRCSAPKLENLTDWLTNLLNIETEALEHRSLPLVEILKQSPTSKMFFSGFNYIHFHIYNDLLKSTHLQINAVEVFEYTDFPFLAQFSIDPRDESLELTLVFANAGFTEEKIENISSIYLASLEAISCNTVPLIKINSQPSNNKSPVSLDTPSLLDQGVLQIASENKNPNSNDSSWSDLELKMLEIWKSVLPGAEIDKDSSFFALGGDSISATRLVALIRKTFSVDLTLRDFFESPQIDGLMAVIRNLSAQPSSSHKRIPKAHRNNP